MNQKKSNSKSLPVTTNQTQLTEKPKHPGGAPSKYPTIDLEFLEKISSLGLTDAQMAGVLNISEKSFYNYLTNDK